ncbi:MAG: VOC family protein [Actinomycetota bacterium]|nr:VOC family protein [Actinomycetota bacterium]
MPTRDTAPVGAPCWVDLMTSDTERSRAFYTELFGWTASEPTEEFGGYFNFSKDGALVAGCMGSEPGSGQPDVWSVYLATDDARKTLEVAAANGGKVMVEAMDVADLGTMAYVGDPGGAAVGVWQPGRHKGFGILGESGAPSWFELHTNDFESVVAFYRQVFRWDTHPAMDTPEFRYTTLGKDRDALAGVMDSSVFGEHLPSRWWIYFGVDDTDAALAKIVELGGKVLRPAEDTPYGRLAEAADPTGAAFKLIHM